ncbi:MAG: hypothetical protein ABIZ56_02225 [Chthoniobacteraceae bacterium]
MNPEALENLLIDRALGHLSPEVEALLAEHLATNPAAARSEADLARTVALAAAAMRREALKLELPPRLTMQQRWRQANRIVAMAASFALGAGVVFLAMREKPTLPHIGRIYWGPTIEQLARTAPTPAPVIAQAPRHSPEIERALKKLPFWSKERAYLIAGAADKTNR